MSSSKHFYINLSDTKMLSWLEIDAFLVVVCVEIIVSGWCVCVCVQATQGQSELPGIQEFSPFFPLFLLHNEHSVCSSRMCCFICCSFTFLTLLFCFFTSTYYFLLNVLFVNGYNVVRCVLTLNFWEYTCKCEICKCIISTFPFSSINRKIT